MGLKQSIKPAGTRISSEKLSLPVHGANFDDRNNRVALGDFRLEFGASKLVQANCIPKAANAREFRTIGSF